MPKIKSQRGSKSKRLEPLGKQIEKDDARKFAKGSKKWLSAKAKEREARKARLEESAGVTDAATTKKIIEFAREQMAEENVRSRKTKVNEKGSGYGNFLDSDDEVDSVYDEDESEYMARDEYEELDVTEADERAIEMFMNTEKPARRTLADIIMEKMKEREAQQGLDQVEDKSNGLSPQMVEVYTNVGKILSRYRAGKVPKAFKIIPSLKNWEEVLWVTEPERWSPQASYVATRLFASNLNPRMAQRYYSLVLLPAVREDIRYNKRLNYHLYLSLKKALYKPAAFFKGVLIPLCEQGCTLREGAIVGSILAKVSIPVLHTSAAMLKIAQMPYAGANSLFLRVMMNKRYNLPYKVIDGLVKHFLGFMKEKRELPVLWHQSLLVFAQRYKLALTQEQKEALKPLLRIHSHYQITPEVRRELFFSVSRQT
mmetsp:Transcript_30799/g.38008  ORF Transcript_30799/g.38008 Transcript_30799/m.38008 type:complete len:427 (-) Transcript_30799:58-1338(-)